MWAMITWTRSWRRTTPRPRSGTSCRGTSWPPIPGERCTNYERNFENPTPQNYPLFLRHSRVTKFKINWDNNATENSENIPPPKIDPNQMSSENSQVTIFPRFVIIKINLFRVWRVLSSQQIMDLRVPRWSAWTRNRSDSAIARTSRRRTW